MAGIATTKCHIIAHWLPQWKQAAYFTYAQKLCQFWQPEAHWFEWRLSLPTFWAVPSQNRLVWPNLVRSMLTFCRSSNYICTYILQPPYWNLAIPFRRLPLFSLKSRERLWQLSMKIHFELNFNVNTPVKMFHQQLEYWHNSSFQVDLRFLPFSIKTNDCLVFTSNNVFLCSLLCWNFLCVRIAPKSDFKSFRHDFFCWARKETPSKKKHNCWFFDSTIFRSLSFSPYLSLSLPRFLSRKRFLFHHLYAKVIWYLVHACFKRKFPSGCSRHFPLARNSSKHIPNVIHYTMNCYLEFNLFSI